MACSEVPQLLVVAVFTFNVLRFSFICLRRGAGGGTLSLKLRVVLKCLCLVPGNNIA